MTALESDAKLLAELMCRKPPHPDESFPPLPLTSKQFGVNNSAFKDLVTELLPKITKSNRHDVQRSYKRALENVLFSLIHALFRWEVLTLVTNADAFKKDSYLSSIGFTRRITEKIINALSGINENEREDASTGWMYLVRKGYRSADGSISNAAVYFPTKRFIELFFHALYTDFGGWDELTDERLYQFNNVLVSDVPPYSDYVGKIGILRNYNTFMREQSWAMKNPSHRTISMYNPRGGRIYNYFQNIAKRRYNVRTRTLLNGMPICECDFSSNHLWMFSYLVGEELPDDAYAAVQSASGCTREQVKHTTTKLLGSTSRKQRGFLVKTAPNTKTPCSIDQFKAIETALLSEYPWLGKHNAFYHDRGAWLQGLEGEISLLMLQWATRNEIPLIAVHDAYAVNHKYENNVTEIMHTYRTEVLEEAKSNKYLEKASHKQTEVVRRLAENKTKNKK